jgi:hypothetical protein
MKNGLESHATDARKLGRGTTLAIGTNKTGLAGEAVQINPAPILC